MPKAIRIAAILLLAIAALLMVLAFGLGRRAPAAADSAHGTATLRQPPKRLMVVAGKELPAGQREFSAAKPIYEYLPGWTEDISGARSLEDLPDAARAYVLALEEMSGARISVIGFGPGREQTVVVHDLV